MGLLLFCPILFYYDRQVCWGRSGDWQYYIKSLINVDQTRTQSGEISYVPGPVILSYSNTSGNTVP